MSRRQVDPLAEGLQGRQASNFYRAEREGFATYGRIASRGGDGRWWHRCIRDHVVHIAVYRHRKRADVVVSLVPTGMQLTEAAQAAIATLVDPFSRKLCGRGHDPFWVLAEDFVWVVVDWSVGRPLAQALLAIVRRPGALERDPYLVELERQRSTPR